MEQPLRATTSLNHLIEQYHSLIFIGWREWLMLPDLGIARIQAKIDTGARTSALHASEVETFTLHHKKYLRFLVHPLRSNPNKKVRCVAPFIDLRWVMDSSGHREKRYVVETSVAVGNQIRNIEMTLTDRAAMKYRMLLGRSAIQQGFVVIPALSYLQGKKGKPLK
jgi:hypothetical protein